MAEIRLIPRGRLANVSDVVIRCDCGATTTRFEFGPLERLWAEKRIECARSKHKQTYPECTHLELEDQWQSD